MKDQVRFIRLQQSLKTEMPSKTTDTNHEYPTSEQYNKVCSALVTKYQFLRDRTGRGYESLHEILKNKIKKERSHLVDIEEINSIRSRFSGVMNQMISPSIQQTSDTKKATNKETADLSVIQDMYQKRQRSEESESGEDEFSIGIHLEKMRTELLEEDTKCPPFTRLHGTDKE